LSPLIISRVYEMLGDARREGKATVVVEQSANDVLQGSDSSFVLRNARLERFDAGASREDLARAYLG
jgi:ABC-type branched-subunit amino acid transport system ATPase component